MDQFILFGDSITQQSFSQDDFAGSFGPALTNAYVRRLDVINRGFSGYNTRQALKVLPNIMPSSQHACVRFMTIFFGANDARLPNTPGGPDQHVPLEEYKSNLRKIATHPSVRAQENIRIILITTPPIDERKLLDTDQAKYPGLASVMRRTAANTAQYAQAVRDLGEELQLPVLDIWTALMKHARGPALKLSDEQLLLGARDVPQSKVLQGFLHDGLHFSRAGYDMLYEELMRLIERTWPDQMPEELPFVLPRWDDEQAWTHETGSEGSTKL